MRVAPLLDGDETTMDIFLKLTQRTCPHGLEDVFYGATLERLGCTQDQFGNFWKSIPRADGTPSRTMFACHMDTVGQRSTRVTHKLQKIEGLTFLGTDGRTILGADDKAGMTILIWMIWHKVPGTYAFFVGEEVGCIGSSDAYAHDPIRFATDFDRCISFDRRNFSDVITYQAGDRCCSDEFAQALATELNTAGEFWYRPSPDGIWTDSAQFTAVIPECTNISVGYVNEHTPQEIIYLAFLEELADAAVKIKWEELPTERDPMEEDNLYYAHGNGWEHFYEETKDGKTTAIVKYEGDSNATISTGVSEGS